MTRKRIGLIVDEFFGGGGTAFGGYGFLARKFIVKYIQDESFQIEVLLGRRDRKKDGLLANFLPKVIHCDTTNLIYLPSSRLFAKLYLLLHKFDAYFSIELTNSYALECEPSKKKKLLLWIQDPRPWSDWREIFTVKLFPENCYWNTKIYELVHRLYRERRVSFISQGLYLEDKARDLYRLRDSTPINYIPNPVDFDESFDLMNYPKKNHIIFLGRIESVKRGWIFCEIAKKMPEYEFYVIGQSFREKEKNSHIMSGYRKIKNLHFTGHLDGNDKIQHLKDAKVLVNTSIHEAIPISFLEALSWGTLIVSNRDPDNLVSRFGAYVGDVKGDGFDSIDRFVAAVHHLCNDETKRFELSIAARQYIASAHRIKPIAEKIKSELRKIC